MSMNSFTRLTMAVFLALAIFGTFASACSDVSTFTFGKKAKTCDTLITEKNREKKCKNKKIRTNCPYSCGSCGAMSCPKQQRSKIFKEPCSAYETGKECGFNHVWTGCNTGDMQCEPRNKFTCSEEESGDKLWKKSKKKKELCEPFDPPRPYGDSCDPKKCPPAEPIEGASCAWFKSPSSKLHGSTCGYEPQWYGCFFGSLSCQYSRQYSCDPVTLTWTFKPPAELKCLPQDNVPIYTPCDIENPVQPKPPQTKPPNTGGETPCPEEEPTSGGCAGNEGQCEYNPIVLGCSRDTISCTPISSYSCDNGIWIIRMFGAQAQDCDNPNVPNGESCDPDTFDGSIYFDLDNIPTDPREKPPNKEYKCPESLPPRDSECDNEDLVPPGGCGYNYLISGCEFKDLTCMPLEEATCNMIGLPIIVTDPETGEDVIQMDMHWTVLNNGMEQCLDVPDDWPAGNKCDPDTFDPNDYIKLTPPDDSGDEPGCPDTVPEWDTPCDGEKSCRYRYNVYGCTPLELTCSAGEWADCEPAMILGKTKDGEYEETAGFKWAIASDSRMQCENVPDGWIDGQACDPETFDPKAALAEAGIVLGN